MLDTVYLFSDWIDNALKLCNRLATPVSNVCASPVAYIYNTSAQLA
jgi:hypothetical protein